MSRLKDRILELEASSAALEPTADRRAAWQGAADRVVNQFLGRLGESPTFSPLGQDFLPDFARTMDATTDLGGILATLAASMGNPGVLAAGPGHLGFVPGGGLYVGAVADHVAAALNAFSADAFSCPSAVHLHEQSVRWLATMVGYGENAWGDLTSGGSHATLTAFFTARQAHGLRARDYEKTCVYLTEHTHHCCEKALRVLFGDDLCVRKLPSPAHVLDVGRLTQAIQDDRQAGLKPWLIVATAGSTNLGRVDPFADLAAVARDHGLWLHVDAAYGGFFNLCEEAKAKFAGLEAADSIVLDPHKGLFLPYGSGAVLIKDGELLRRSMGQDAAYLQDRRGPLQHSPMDYSLELTRPFRSFRLWLALKVHGEELFRTALREKLLLARYLWEQLAGIPDLCLIGRLDLSILAFRHRESDALTKDLLERIRARQDVFLSSTVVDGHFVIRAAILSFRTHLKTIDRLVEIVRAETSSMRHRH